MTTLRHSRWRPILGGAAREKALGVVDAIATEVRKIALASSLEAAAESARRPAEEAPLAEGRAGLAILYGYLAAARPGDVDREAAVRLLDQAADAVSSVRMPPSLYGGFTGVAWAMAHLEGRLADSGAGDANADVDDALIDFLGQSPWRRDYDLVSGLVGFGVYAIERLPRPTAVECLKRVIDRLEESAQRSPQGISWFTGPELLSAEQLERRPGGYYNLGVAHGVPGVIALLGAACAAGVARRKARALLDGAVAWLEAQRLPARAGSIFPALLGPGIEPVASRSAWCYGDPGVAAALLLAARSVAERAWERRALEIALRAANRAPEKVGVVDAGLCHGAAGLGHLFNRMFQTTGEKRLGQAARFWIRRALELRRPGQGVAGFSAWGLGEDGTRTWLADPGILTGAAGIALALLAAATPIEPSWDRMLLMSVPSRSVSQ